MNDKLLIILCMSQRQCLCTCYVCTNFTLQLNVDETNQQRMIICTWYLGLQGWAGGRRRNKRQQQSTSFPFLASSSVSSAALLSYFDHFFTNLCSTLSTVSAKMKESWTLLLKMSNIFKSNLAAPLCEFRHLLTPSSSYGMSSFMQDTVTYCSESVNNCQSGQWG